VKPRDSNIRATKYKIAAPNFVICFIPLKSFTYYAMKPFFQLQNIFQKLAVSEVTVRIL
jgi:hypothetical protein